MSTYFSIKFKKFQFKTLSQYLQENNMTTAIHYPIPIHLQPAARFLGYKRGSFKSAEKQAKRILTLPVNQYLKHGEVKRISEKINFFYMKNL